VVLKLDGLGLLLLAMIDEGEDVGDGVEPLTAQLLHHGAALPPPGVGLLRPKDNQKSQNEGEATQDVCAHGAGKHHLGEG